MVFAVNSVADLPTNESAPDPGWAAGAAPDPGWAAGATSAIRAAESRKRWAQEVAQALETLRPDERSFVQLSYFDGLGHAQIAEQAGVPAESVPRVIAAGMRQLARMLEQA